MIGGRDVILLQALQVLSAGIVDPFWVLLAAFSVPASGLAVVPHAESETAASPAASASFAEGMTPEGRG